MTAEIHALARAARSQAAPCGDGQLAWRAWGAAEAPAVMLLHGGSGSWRHRRRNIRALGRAHHVLAPDRPGLGESATPPGERTPAGRAEARREGLAALLGPARRDHLVGFRGRACGRRAAKTSRGS
jgi:pimeloyl-ACP methyl ester carboxylesterase